jgi:hypothetical protein
MRRNSDTLYLQSPGAVTPIPWVNGEPDFTGFTEPTLSVLQQSWQEFLDSGEELEVIPDPEPIAPAPYQDWPAFNYAMSINTKMIEYEIVANQRHPSIVAKKDLAYSIISDKGLDNFAIVYPLFCQIAEVKQEDKSYWADVAQSFNLPTDFVSLIRG